MNRNFISSDHKIRIMIVDDHPLFRDGLQRALELEDDMQVVGFCDNGADAPRAIMSHQPDVVLLDVNMPGMNGLQVTRALRADDVEVGVVILTAHHDNEQILHAMRTGASAYCEKNIASQTLMRIVRAVAAGNYVVNEAIMDEKQMESWLAERIEEETTHTGFFDSEGHFIPLSQREMEILEYVTKGLINKEIARLLGISQQTVKNHMTSILKKLNVSDRTQAAVMALRRGWVRIDKDTHQEA
jgi:DNA-binding NarL/FixJ family response regulator